MNLNFIDYGGKKGGDSLARGRIYMGRRLIPWPYSDHWSETTHYPSSQNWMHGELTQIYIMHCTTKVCQKLRYSSRVLGSGSTEVINLSLLVSISDWLLCSIPASNSRLTPAANSSHHTFCNSHPEFPHPDIKEVASWSANIFTSHF